MTSDPFDLGNDGAAKSLRAYFDEGSPHRYSGRRFEALANGGDRPGVHNVITADDLVAVQMLSVSVPAEVAVDLLEGQLGRQMTDRLARIPLSVELGTSGAMELVADGNDADQAWHCLKSRPDVGYVIAGKLLARKRPHLIPVYDQVIACLFGEPDRVWLRLHDRLAADGGQLREELAVLRTRANVHTNVSLLRILDVVLWMAHHDTHRTASCSGFGTFPLS
ncbi:DUF6308 family protein [Dactylosporangium sp. CA-139066]|uniref:DUF6308 family protein n=1 Tax=Dactylosporangium sp. CA-139066 TaxID=3239930 RepID=UPI003D8BAD53